MSNLGNEGFQNNVSQQSDKPQIINVGDVMYDAVQYYRGVAEPSVETGRTLNELSESFFLATVHRAENTDDPKRLAGIIEGLERVASDVPVILPLHPRTRKKIEAGGKQFDRVLLIDPVGYFDMLVLLGRCRAVLTDSGGMQKEAYFFGKPCITLRDETEWVELIDGGYNLLAGADPDRIVESVNIQCSKSFDWNKQLYGDGNAAEKILASIMSG